MSWSTTEFRVRLALLNWFKPWSKIFYWPFQGGTSFVDLLCLFLSCVCYVYVHVCLYVLCGHLLEKGWPLGSRLCCLTVSLSLSHWYPGSDVVLNFIVSLSLHPYLLCTHSHYVEIVFFIPWRTSLKRKSLLYVYMPYDVLKPSRMGEKKTEFFRQYSLCSK